MQANWPTAIIAAFWILLSRVGSDLMQVRGQDNISGKQPVPSYLKGYKKLYEKDPHAAAVEWFIPKKLRTLRVAELSEGTPAEALASLSYGHVLQALLDGGSVLNDESPSP